MLIYQYVSISVCEYVSMLLYLYYTMSIGNCKVELNVSKYIKPDAFQLVYVIAVTVLKGSP